MSSKKIVNNFENSASYNNPCIGCLNLVEIPNTKFHKCKLVDKNNTFYPAILRTMAQNINDLFIADKTVIDEKKCKINSNNLKGSTFPYRFILKNNIVKYCEYREKLSIETISIPSVLPENF